MKNILKKINMLFLIIGISVLFSISSSFAAEGQCSGAQPCSSLPQRCVAQKQKNGQYAQQSSKNVICGDCVKKNTQNGCFNSNPTSQSGSYFGLGYRPNGAGGNPKPRNHYGADIGGGGQTNILVYAAADGVVSYAGTSGGGGRTLAITHTKGCSGAGDKNTYTTLYRHLLAYKVSKGQSVKKGDVIGIEGGSNAKSAGAAPCDNSSQLKMGGTTAGCGKSYAIHLHFEVVNNLDLLKCSSCGTGIGDKQVLHPDCGGLQVLCGGCDVNLGTLCQGEKNCSADDGNRADMSDASFNTNSNVDAEGNPDDGCRFGDYLQSDTCVFCRLFKTIFNSASEIAYIANYKFAGPTKDLVALGFAIWIALYLLKHVSSLSQQTTGQMLKGILFQGFRVAVIVLMLGGAMYEVMNVTLTPVLKTGFNFANILNNVRDEAEEAGCDTTADYMENIQGYDESTGFPDIKEDLRSAINASGGGTASTTKIGGLPKEVGESIICGIKKMEDSTSYLMSLGKYSSCIAFGRHKIFFKSFPHIGYLTTGIVLWLCGALLLLTFPWFLVDCILQFCIAAALLPCAIGAYAFKVTSKYLKKIWDLFMNAMFNFVFMSVIMYVINSNLNTWIGYTPGTDPDEHIFVNALTLDGLAWWGIGALKIGLIMILCWSFFGEARELASKFADEIGLNIGKKVGGTAYNIAKQSGLTAGKTIYNGASGVASGISNTAHAIGAGWDLKNKAAMNAIRRLPGAKVTQNADGSTTVSHNFSLFGFNRQVSATQDADGHVSRTTTTHFAGNALIHGRTVTQTNDGYSTVTERRGENGEIIGRKTSIGDLQFLTRKDGMTDLNVYNRIMNTSVDKNQAAESIVLQHLKQRNLDIDSQTADRQTTINSDGSITITQTNRDGTSTLLNARMIGNQMVIDKQTSDKQGNVLRTVSNGIQTKTERYTRQEDGTYKVQSLYAFSDYIQRINRTHPPLAANGTWGISINHDQAMAGFTQQDFDKHINQLNGKNTTQNVTAPAEIQGILNKAFGTASAQVMAMTPTSLSEFDLSQVDRGQALLNQLNASNSDTSIKVQIASMSAGELQALSLTLEQNQNVENREFIQKRLQYAVTDEINRTNSERLQQMNTDDLLSLVQLADKRRIAGDQRADALIKQALSVASTDQKNELLASTTISTRLRTQIVQNLDDDRIQRGQEILNSLSGDGQDLQQQVKDLDMNGLLSLSQTLGDPAHANDSRTESLQSLVTGIIGDRLHDIHEDENLLSQMNQQDLAATTVLADMNRQNPDGTPNLESMDIITRAISNLDAKQKASMLLTDTLSDELSKELMGPPPERPGRDLMDTMLSQASSPKNSSFSLFDDEDDERSQDEIDEGVRQEADEERQQQEEARQRQEEEDRRRQEQQENDNRQQESPTFANPLIEQSKELYKSLTTEIRSVKELIENASRDPNSSPQIPALQNRLDNLEKQIEHLRDLLGDDFKKLKG